MPRKTIKTRYAAPIQKRVGDAQLGKEDLQFFGRCLVKYVREEARKDAAKSKSVPLDKNFYESFGYKITSRGIEITSNWPIIDLIIHGTDGPYPMTWLTQQAHRARGEATPKKAKPKPTKVPKPGAPYSPPTIQQLVAKRRASNPLIVPLRDRSGDVIFRTAPLTTDSAWIHPGFAKHNFVNRAFERARNECLVKWAKKNVERVLGEEQARHER